MDNSDVSSPEVTDSDSESENEEKYNNDSAYEFENNFYQSLYYLDDFVFQNVSFHFYFHNFSNTQ